MPARQLVVSRYLQYIAIAVGLVLLVLFTRQISGVILTFFMAALLAYVLNPLIRRLEGMKVPRTIAVLGVFAALVLGFSAAALIILVPAIQQIQTLIANPELITDAASNLIAWARDLPYVGERIGTAIDEGEILGLIQSNLPPASAIFSTGLGFIGGVFGIFGTILNLSLMLIISIYILLDRERMTNGLIGMIPSTVRNQALELFETVEETLVKYVKAQALLCVLMGVIGWAIVFFTGGEYAILIGVWVGITELIPVLGAFLGAIPAVLLALVNSPTEALIVALLFLVAQQLEGNILVPRIMGGSVGVHPLWVMFAMLSASALYGIVGALFAVPVVAIVSATVRYLRETLVLERWRESLLAPSLAADGPPESSGDGEGTEEAEEKP
ncbi:MAG: AI-2E family transporter [Rubrobacter sp.]|nr:AI-2E family transporter [Rubrobacter sp.]